MVEALLLIAFSLLVTQSRQENPCDWFFAQLNPIPHTVLSVRSDVTLVSLWGGEEFNGCELKFETTDSLLGEVKTPDFDAYEGSEMVDLGWETTEGIRADGPGSGIYGIENQDALCVVRWSQPAYIDDDGTFVQSDTFSMTIQCRERNGDR